MMPGFPRRRLLLLMFVSVLIVGFVGLTTAAAAPGRPFANPVKAQKGADPWIEYYNGSYYLVTTSWTSVLTMRKSPTLAGLATAPSVQVWASDQASAWTKSPQPVFQRDDANGVYGPGHNGFFTSPDGTEDWIVYHANDSASDGCDNNRTTRAQRFTWNADGRPNFGTPVRLGTTLDGPAGETAATPTASTIVNRNSGKCLQVTGTTDGVAAQQAACTGANSQRWRFEDMGDDASRLVNVNSGKVADVADCGTADGTAVRQWAWLNNACQQWRLQPA